MTCVHQSKQSYPPLGEAELYRDDVWSAVLEDEQSLGKHIDIQSQQFCIKRQHYHGKEGTDRVGYVVGKPVKVHIVEELVQVDQSRTML